MSNSFLDKLQSKLNERSLSAAGQASQGSGSVSASKPKDSNAETGKPPAEGQEQKSDGSETESQRDLAEEVEGSWTPIDVDVFQTQSEVIVFAQAGGVPPEDFDITLDEEKNILLIRGARSRPPFPPQSKAATDPEKEGKGRFVTQECNWEKLYRKVHLPTAVDGGDAEVVLTKGVLVFYLPIAKPGAAKHLGVREQVSEDPSKKS